MHNELFLEGVPGTTGIICEGGKGEARHQLGS